MMHPVTHDLLKWYDKNKRSLPWRDVRTPYGSLVSEVMLQQTRVDTVIPYYNAFLNKFPTVEALASAQLDDVLAMWSGLGYYSRARNLHKAANQIVEKGTFPRTLKEIRSLSGVGEYIAGAIASMAFDLDVGAVDGNLHRVLSRIHCDGGDRKRMWAVIEPLLPTGRCGDFNQALMDLGSSICKKIPVCVECPIRAHCQSYTDGRTAEFPVVKKKKAPKKECFVALLIRSTRDGDTILMGKRKGKALYGGMVEPCLLTSVPDQILDANMWVDKHIPSWSAHELSWLDRGTFTHILSHKRLEIRVLETVLSEEQVIESEMIEKTIPVYESIKWYSKSDRDSVGISSLALKIIGQANHQQLSLF